MSKKCLVVDDVAVSRYANRMIAEDLGFDVVEADGGDACLDEVKKNKFDLIFLDWHLRRENGLLLINKILASPDHHSVKIIVCTGVENLSAEAEARNAGAVGFIIKPTTREKIETELKKIALI